MKSPYFVRETIINLYGYYLSRRRFNKQFYHLLDELMLNLQKTPSQIKSEQLKLLKNTLIQAYSDVPYYKETFDYVGFNPFEFSEINELSKLPFLDKSVIRKNFDKLKSQAYSPREITIHSTSGSTGEKLKFYQPKDLTYTINAAFWYRFYALFDIHPKDKRVTIGGRRFTSKPPYWSYNRFENQLLLSSHHLSNLSGIDYINKINEFKPVFIQGHPNSILFLANLIIQGKAKILIPIKAIFTTGETLIEENRSIIKHAFNTGVYQQYGSGESVFSAQETPDEVGYMLNYEHGYVELIGEGDYKEVVATSFKNPVMPFIRYKIGDLVKPINTKVKSNYSLPFLFDEVIGRVDDMLSTTEGEQLLPVVIRMNIKPFLLDNTNYQLIQRSQKDFELKLVDDQRKISVRKVQELLKELIGNDMVLNIQYVDTILSEGGKIRNVINNFKK